MQRCHSRCGLLVAVLIEMAMQGALRVAELRVPEAGFLKKPAQPAAQQSSLAHILLKREQGHHATEHPQI